MIQEVGPFEVQEVHLFVVLKDVPIENQGEESVGYQLGVLVEVPKKGPEGAQVEALVEHPFDDLVGHLQEKVQV